MYMYFVVQLKFIPWWLLKIDNNMVLRHVNLYSDKTYTIVHDSKWQVMEVVLPILFILLAKLTSWQDWVYIVM